MFLIPVTLIVMLIMACAYINADDIAEDGWKPASTKLSFIVTIVLLGLLVVLW